tara:strand:- start:2647 stop:3351 length:705 start_codon:yes stop_codon:yes gene_type:complete
MGYLDNTTVTVDAVLTKRGREIISAGGSLNITQFTLSDTGVSYNLWNPDHPSGSAYYGEAIENLPQLEATTQVQYSLRNKLLTLNRDAEALPIMDLSISTLSFTTSAQQNVTTQLLGMSNMGASSGIHLLVQDVNIVQPVNVGTPVDVTGNALSFIVEQDIPNARLYEIAGAYPQSIGFVPTLNLPSNSSTNLTFIDIQTGAYNTLPVDVNADIVPRTQVTTKAKAQGPSRREK